MKKIMIGVLVLALVSGIGIFALGQVAAAEDGETVNPFIARLAEVLNIDPATLSDAVRQVQVEGVQEQVAQGSLTPEEGERIKDQINNGGFGFGGGGYYCGGGGRGMMNGWSGNGPGMMWGY